MHYHYALWPYLQSIVFPDRYRYWMSAVKVVLS
jgi:hypothetical protein